MKHYSHLLYFFIILVITGISMPLFAQTEAPFTRGVNLSGWFQAGTAQQIHFARYTKTDFEQIQSLGCDVIRLPINLHGMTQGAPDYRLEPLFLMFLDSAVTWAEEVGIHLILDNHSFDPSVNTDPAIEDVLTKTWEQLATRYQSRSDLILFEILNEPHGIDDGVWGAIQGRVIDAIRDIDERHTLIVGPASWNSYNNLSLMPSYADTNLIYTFHFYDPFIFTHQGATWTGIPLQDLSNMPFPYDANRMPTLPSSLVGTWVEGGYQNYANEGTLAHMQQLLDIAISFQQSRGVPLFCGEFGVYQANSLEPDRVRWYEGLVNMLDSAGIAWTMWDYHGGFGIFEEGSDGLFDHDLNVPLLNAMGLNVPTQTGFQPQPDSSGFFVYRDYIEQGILESSGVSGTLSFYGENQANYGNYHIRWEDADQYNQVGFDFSPDRDLGYLEAEGFALDFFVRGEGNAVNQSLDVRFVDTKTGTEERPWRIRSAITVSGPGWQHYHIPLSDFTEHGSWDNNTWYNPQGLFDWQAIDRLGFVAESGGFTGVISLDHIQLTELDTAQVNTSTSVVTQNERPVAWLYPNPFRHELNVRTVTKEAPWQLLIVDMVGRVVYGERFDRNTRLDLSSLVPGMYLLNLQQGNQPVVSYRILKE